MKSDNQPKNKYDGKIFLYYGDISREGYSQISALYEERTEKKDKICLILITDGGDPDAAYRIARATNHHFDDVEILIPDICKSAGTLLCIGAQKLIFGDRGELGPLDIQLSKPDEMLERMSGLDIIQAINALQNQT
ncbi:MAG: SppA protein, partial [Candidatus Electrothrix sp. AUS3]|nr:SppA protein [Candidatus Electrothrix gigas]